MIVKKGNKKALFSIAKKATCFFLTLFLCFGMSSEIIFAESGNTGNTSRGVKSSQSDKNAQGASEGKAENNSHACDIKYFDISWCPVSDQVNSRYEYTINEENEDGSFLSTFTECTGSDKWIDSPEKYPVFQKGVIDLSMFSEDSYDKDQIEIRMPAHIYHKRDSEEYADILVTPVPDSPTSSNEFYKTYDSKTDEWVIKNSKPLLIDTSESHRIEFAYAVHYPWQVKSYTKGEVGATVSIQEKDGTITGAKTRDIEGQIITGIRGISPWKEKEKVYMTWQDEWTDACKPENPDDYIYFMWVVSTNIYHKSQPYEVKIEDIPKTEGLEVLGYTDARISAVYNDGPKYYPEAKFSYKQAPNVRVDKPTDGMRLNENGNSLAIWRVLTCMPKDKLQQEKEIKNSVKAWTKGVDETEWHGSRNEYSGTVYDSSSKESSFTYKPFVVSAIQPDFDFYKENRNSVASGALTRLLKGEKVKASGFRTYGAVYGGSLCLEEGADPKNLDNYGKREYSVDEIDEMYILGDPEKDEPYVMAEEDFQISTVRLWHNSVSKPKPDYDTGRIQYEKMKNKDYPDNEIWLSTLSGQWQKAGTYGYKDGKICIYEYDSSLIKVTTNTSYKAEFMPVKPFQKIKLSCKTGAPKIDIVDMICDIQINPTKSVVDLAKKAVDTAGDDKPELQVNDINSLCVKDDKGNIQFINQEKKCPPGWCVLNDAYKEIMRKQDKENYGVDGLIPHRTASTKLIDFHKYSYLRKEASKVENNTEEKQFEVTYELNLLEQTSFRDITLQEMIDQGFVEPIESGTFYDLLPEGMIVGRDDIHLENDGEFTYEIKPNWRNSNRNLLVIHVKGKPFVESGRNSVEYKWQLTYKGIYPWSDLNEWGRQPYNSVAFETGNASIAKGLADTGGDLKDKNLMSNLDPESKGAKRFLYDSEKVQIQGLISTDMEVSKRVKAQDDSVWLKDTETVTAGTYQYKIRTNNFDDTQQKDLLFLDKLERAPLKGNRWRGTLNNVDVSHLEKLGCAPVVYYSQTEDIDFNDKKHLDFTDANKWTTQMPEDKSSIVAIAVDASKRVDGSPFVLDNGKETFIIINMDAPDDVYEVWDLYKKKALACNEATVDCTFIRNTPTGDIEAYGAHDTAKTTVKLKEPCYGLDITKYLNDRGLDLSGFIDTDDKVPDLSKGEGVEFSVFKDVKNDGCAYDKNEDVELIARASTDEQGKVTLSGMAPGNYWLVETKAHAGYILADPIHIHINPYEGSKDDLIHLTQYKSTSDMCEIVFDEDLEVSRTEGENVYAHINLINEKMLKLPASGSSGRRIIALVGLSFALVGIAAFALSTFKNRQKRF